MRLSEPDSDYLLYDSVLCSHPDDGTSKSFIEAIAVFTDYAKRKGKQFNPMQMINGIREDRFLRTEHRMFFYVDDRRVVVR